MNCWSSTVQAMPKTSSMKGCWKQDSILESEGTAGKVTARTCLALADHTDHIGLNVHAGNTAAIRCYERLGFEVNGGYEECTLVRKDLV